MKTYRETVTLYSNGSRPAFHRFTESAREAVRRSGITDGICVVYSHHTTCSVMIQECSFDTAASGLEFMQQDLINAFEKLLPVCSADGRYLHPGPKAIAFAAEHGESAAEARNTDAHLRSALLGRSETVVVMDGDLDLGQFGHIYFVDFDTTHPRERQAQIQVMGD